MSKRPADDRDDSSRRGKRDSQEMTHEPNEMEQPSEELVFEDPFGDEFEEEDVYEDEDDGEDHEEDEEENDERKVSGNPTQAYVSLSIAIMKFNSVKGVYGDLVLMLLKRVKHWIMIPAHMSHFIL
jgi:hypothetical protein